MECTRSRPYKKNDNAHSEQKNGTHVRKIVGYQRLETPDAVIEVNELSAGPLRQYRNFFQPTMQLITKERVGGRLQRVYDIAQTPYERVLASDHVAGAEKERLRSAYRRMNPAQWKRDGEQRIRTLRAIPTTATHQRKRSLIYSPAVTFSVTERLPARLYS